SGTVLLLVAVEVPMRRAAAMAEIPSGIDERGRERRGVRDWSYVHRAGGPVIREVLGCVRQRATVEVLGALEVRQHLVEAPAVVAEPGPPVEVSPVAADVDHAVHRVTAAEDHAAIDNHAAPVKAPLRLGLHRHADGATPGRPDDAAGVTNQRVDVHALPDPGVRPAPLEQEHAGRLTQPARDDAARRAGADDDVVEHLWLTHAFVIAIAFLRDRDLRCTALRSVAGTQEDDMPDQVIIEVRANVVRALGRRSRCVLRLLPEGLRAGTGPSSRA